MALDAARRLREERLGRVLRRRLKRGRHVLWTVRRGRTCAGGSSTGTVCRRDGLRVFQTRTAHFDWTAPMKSLMTVTCSLVFTPVPVLAAPVWAADGRVSRESLASFGLAGMTAIPDVQGTTIRGTPVPYWPLTQSTFVIPAFTTRFVFQWRPTPVTTIWDRRSTGEELWLENCFAKQ
jgi:hypothetical protein